MAALTVQTVTSAGLSVQTDGVAADVAGDTYQGTGKEILSFHNGDVSATTVTITTPQVVDGLAVADQTISVAAGETEVAAFFPIATYNDAGGAVNISYSSVTSLSVLVSRAI